MRTSNGKRRRCRDNPNRLHALLRRFLYQPTKKRGELIPSARFASSTRETGVSCVRLFESSTLCRRFSRAASNKDPLWLTLTLFRLECVIEPNHEHLRESNPLSRIHCTPFPGCLIETRNHLLTVPRRRLRLVAVVVTLSSLRRDYSKYEEGDETKEKRAFAWQIKMYQRVSTRSTVLHYEKS